MTSNPLLDESSLLNFSDIKAEHFEPALDAVLTANKEAIKNLLKQKTFTWKNFAHPMEDISVKLNNMWSVVSHLHGVCSTDKIREAYNKCLPKLIDYGIEISQNKKMFTAYEKIHDSENFKQLTIPQKKSITNELRDFKLSGVNLPGPKKRQYKTIQQRISALTTKFDENILDATDKWEKHVTAADVLAGIPAHSLARFKTYAEQKGLSGWLLNIEMPNYITIIRFAENRSLREEVYTAYVTRASDQGPNAKQFDNSKIMTELLKSRHEKSQLLGFENYADYSLATKMAPKNATVINFLKGLAEQTKGFADDEFQELQEYAKYHHNLEKIAVWDVTFVSEQYQKYKYDLSQEDIRPYFMTDNVLTGLFSIVEKIFDIHVIEKMFDVNTWHEDVRCFEIYDANNQAVASFYLDLFARPQKKGGAWMDECRDAHQFSDGNQQKPSTFLICNFSKPSEGEPSLLTHDEVLTLFHEFGHGLHHMLTKINISSVSGINGVPWDAVEFPSQFLENYCWEKQVLDLIGCHYITKEPLPETLYKKLVATKNFHSAMHIIRQLTYALFDFRIYLEFNPEKGNQIQTIINEVRQKLAVIKVPSFDRFQHGFSHIFSGGYAAGYYSYLWAEVLARDAFSPFKHHGIFDKATGKKFLETILAKGGSEEPMELFLSFMGREPKIEALLESYGINKNQ